MKKYLKVNNLNENNLILSKEILDYLNKNDSISNNENKRQTNNKLSKKFSKYIINKNAIKKKVPKNINWFLNNNNSYAYDSFLNIYINTLYEYINKFKFDETKFNDLETNALFLLSKFNKFIIYILNKYSNNYISIYELYEAYLKENNESNFLGILENEISDEFANSNRLYSATIELTYRCNEKCRHCYVYDEGGEEMSTNQIMKIC